MVHLAEDVSSVFVLYHHMDFRCDPAVLHQHVDCPLLHSVFELVRNRFHFALVYFLGL